MVLFLLILSKSLPKKRIIKPIGVTTIKNTAPITIGDTIEPKNIPSLNQSLLRGVNNLEFRTPKIKKIIDKTNDHNLNSSPDFKGHKAIIKNTTKNTSPKLRFDESFILDLEVMNYSIFLKDSKTIHLFANKYK